MTIMRYLAIAIGMLLVASCSQKQEPSQHSKTGSAPKSMSQASDVQLTWTAPEGWVAEEPSSGMRLAQYKLPKVEGDEEDASCYVFHFPGAGGSVEANIQRWYGQFDQPDGQPSSAVAKVNKGEVHGFQLTTVDLTGSFKPSQMGMGQPGDSSELLPNYRMLGGVVETPSGPWFAKLVGPERTVAHWEKSFHEFMGSFKPQAH
jgi:hypothetical protein